MSTDYASYYEAQLSGQHGGQLRVFRGGLQSGAGLGDVLRGLFRFIAPVALRAIGTFATNTLAGTQAGVPLMRAARAAIGPTIGAIGRSVIPTAASNVMNAAGRHQAPGYDGDTDDGTSSVKTRQQRGQGGALFDGVDGIPTTAQAIHQYKRGGLLALEQHSHKRAPTRKRKHQPDVETVNF